MFYLLSVAALGVNLINNNSGLISLQVENGTQIQVPKALMQTLLKEETMNSGVETLRIPNLLIGHDDTINLPINCRELECEVCLICRRCGRAYPQESTLLAHQRSCYLGNQQRRGAIRLVQTRFSCSICDTATSTRTYGTMNEWRRHAETVQHRARLDTINSQKIHHQLQQQHNNNQVEIMQDLTVQSGEEANPLTDEMEDVVNQITLLAARAAAESTTINATSSANQDNNNGPDVKRPKHVQEITTLTGGGH